MALWTPGIKLEGWEKIAIEECYTYCRRNKTTTAQMLGISVRTLDAKLEKYEAQNHERAQADLKVKQAARADVDRQRYAHPSFQIPSSISHLPPPTSRFSQVMMNGDVPVVIKKPE